MNLKMTDPYIPQTNNPDNFILLPNNNDNLNNPYPLQNIPIPELFY